jgi:hypothetical protein
LLAGLFFWGKGEISSNTVTKYEIQNPSGLKVIEYHQVKVTDRLAISITLQNSGNSEWKKVAITSELLLGGKYTGERGISFEDVKQGEIEHGLISFDDIRNELVKDSVVCQFKIEGNPKRK